VYQCVDDKNLQNVGARSQGMPDRKTVGRGDPDTDRYTVELDICRFVHFTEAEHEISRVSVCTPVKCALIPYSSGKIRIQAVTAEISEH
jgi:hypothetical protein